MREIVELFLDRESRDELGIGVIRDAIADGLFPGTSTLLTRARYLLFIPWCYQLAVASSDPAWTADWHERRLIAPLSGLDGAFGRVSGTGLKRLPGSVYWAPLTRWGILLDPDAALSPVPHRLREDDAARRPASAWVASLPPVPEGFPSEVPGGFDLTLVEARFLRDRMLATADDSLLAWLLDHRPSGSGDLWQEPAVLGAPGEIAALVHHGRMFAAALHGAALVYNLLLAEELPALGLTPPPRLPDYRQRLEDWAANAETIGLLDWSTAWLWRWLAQQAVRVPPATRVFVEGWVRLLGNQSAHDLADAPQVRSFIRERERRHKRSQARLGNRRRLSQWGGASGAMELEFRWPQARRILLDIHDGLERDA
ncbi:DUF6361 family protein [Tessaracoccus defluvii]